MTCTTMAREQLFALVAKESPDSRIHVSDDGVSPHCRNASTDEFIQITAPDIWNWGKQVCSVCGEPPASERFLRSISTNTAQQRLREPRLDALEAKTLGRAPEAIGDLSSEAFVRGLRDAWE